MNLKGKHVLITGGTTGIGLACARQLRERGATVSVCGFHELDFRPGEVDRAWFGDLVDEDFRRMVVSETLTRFGRIDVLINSAGVGLYAPASESCLEEVERMFKVNVFSMLRMVQLTRPHMSRAGGGVVVNIGSVGALASLPWSTMYCTSKYAVHGLTEGLYRELRAERIHVMLVVPGIVATGFREHVLAGRVPEEVGRIRRVITPEQLAAAIVEGIERGRRRVTTPRLAYLFELVNRLFPFAIDWYCARKWRPDPVSAFHFERAERDGITRDALLLTPPAPSSELEVEERRFVSRRDRNHHDRE